MASSGEVCPKLRFEQRKLSAMHAMTNHRGTTDKEPAQAVGAVVTRSAIVQIPADRDLHEPSRARFKESTAGAAVVGSL